ncbi:MAG TPA: TraR/DksA family transcriptional regulator [Burkholderiales bacterium]
MTQEQTRELARRIGERKATLLDEVRRGLARSHNERYAAEVAEAGDAADASVAELLRHVTEAEVRRDVLELRDIVAAEGRLASGRYGVCIDCGAAIGHARLDAYPTAKRCLRCQQERERTGRYGPRPSL